MVLESFRDIFVTYKKSPIFPDTFRELSDYREFSIAFHLFT